MGGIRWGILATGNIAGQFTADLQRNGHQVIAVGSRSGARAAEFAARFGIARAHGSHRALVADPEVDAVYVATPHPFHAEAALLAIEAGKHVLVEKPFALNAAQAADVFDRAATRGVLALEAMWVRYLPHMEKLRELLAAGAIGEPRSLVATHTRALSSDPHHRLNAPELGGGALLDLGVYLVSFATDLLGEPEVVSATARFKPTGVDAQTTATLRHPNGAVSLLLCASDSEGPNAAQIVGSEGYLELDPIWLFPTTVKLYGRDRSLRDIFPPEVTGRGLHYEAAELERLITDRDRQGVSRAQRQTLAALRSMDAIRSRIGLRYPGETG